MTCFDQLKIVTSMFSEPALFGTRKWKMLVAFKCLLEIQSRAAKIDAIGMFFYTEGNIEKC